MNMLNRLGEDYYGFGTIQNTVPEDLDSLKPMKGERDVCKEVINIDPKIKVDKDKGDNQFKKYIEEPVDKLNFGERERINFDTAIEFLEPMENQNLDFDGDNQPDFNYGDGFLKGVEASKAMEAGKDLGEAEGEQQLEEKPVAQVVKEKPIMEPERELKAQESRPTMEGNKDNRLKNTDNAKDSQIKMADGVIMAAGALAVAMMVMGKT